MPQGPDQSQNPKGRDLDKMGSFWSSFRNNNDDNRQKSIFGHDSTGVSAVEEDGSASATPISSPTSHQAGTYTSSKNNYDVSYREMNRVERDYEMKNWDSNVETIKLYSHLLISFGYVAIFGCLLPGISLLGVLDIYLIYKKDAFRFINVFKRLKEVVYNTDYEGNDTNIGGMYYLLFNTFLSITFMTNSLLIVFTMKNFNSLSISIRLWILIAINGTMFGFRHIAMLFMTKEPNIVNIQRMRTRFICKQLVEGVADEEADPTSIL